MLNHPNILKIYEVIRSEDNIFIVMDYCPYGDLLYNFDFRRKQRRKFTEADYKLIFRGILQSINHMHSNNYMHRDIKPRNILLSSQTDLSQTMVIDFGCVQEF